MSAKIPTSKLFFDASVRVESVIYIPGAVADFESTPDAFKEDFCYCLPERKDAPLYAALPSLKRFLSGGAEPDEIAEALLFTDGFLVQAATPVMRCSADGNSADFSWGYYRTEWLYAPTGEAITTVCLKWAEESDKRDRAKSAAESAAA